MPPPRDLEKRLPQEVQDKLTHATRNCSNAYRKGNRSFQALEQIDPANLQQLPNFARAMRILSEKLS